MARVNVASLLECSFLVDCLSVCLGGLDMRGVKGVKEGICGRRRLSSEMW